jgi:hypothetical protein
MSGSSIPRSSSALPALRCVRRFTMPLKSSLVVRSAASLGGFWFHPSCSVRSSVREGQFIPRMMRRMKPKVQKSRRARREKVYMKSVNELVRGRECLGNVRS